MVAPWDDSAMNIEPDDYSHRADAGSHSPQIETKEEFARLLRCYEAMRVQLSNVVFRSELGWERTVSRDSMAVLFSLWDAGEVGFAFGITSNGSSAPFIAVYCTNAAEERLLHPMLRFNEVEIRRRLGRGFWWEEEHEYPLGEYVREDKPEKIASRLIVYRDAFTPYLNRLKPRWRKLK